jgi:hypothetical protein
MADSIWGQSPLSAALEAYKTTSEIPAQRALLSARAEEAQLKVKEEKEAYATRMATRMALSQAEIQNKDSDLSSIQGNIQVLDSAIKNTSDPEVKQSLFSSKQSLLSDQYKLSQEAGKAREDQRAQTMESASEAFAMGPEGADTFLKLGSDTGNKLFSVIGHQLKDELPIASMGNRRYSQLTPSEQNAYKNSILRSLSPKPGEATIKDVIREQADQAKLDETKRNDDLKYQAAMARVASDRERINIMTRKEESKLPKQLADLYTKTSNDVNALRLKQKALLIKAGMPATGVTVEHWYGNNHKDLPPEIKDAYDSIESDISNRLDAADRAEKTLTKGAPPPAKKGTGTASDPIVLD